MKSAYELAMERLGNSDPEVVKELSVEQKQKLQEIEIRYQAKFAEREVFLKEQIAKAEASGQHSEIPLIRRQLVDEKASIEEDKELEKDKVRNS